MTSAIRLQLFRQISWQSLLSHPWRTAAAVIAVMLGVALGFAVQTINASALHEFERAVRSVQGQPDLELSAAHGTLPQSLYSQVARLESIDIASPWLEIQALASRAAHSASVQKPVTLRILGTDALNIASTAPALMPRAFKDAERLAMLAPKTIFLNASALQALGLAADVSSSIRLQGGDVDPQASIQVAGSVAATGAPLGVMDIAAAQDLFGRDGALSRIDLQLRTGADVATVQSQLQALPGWPQGVLMTVPGDATQRVDNLSRAYRINLSVLALVALFTGAYLVYSVLALGVAQRAQQLALLAVLGLTAQERRGLVLAEAAVIGIFGSVTGIALGTAIAALAMRVLGGDLGGGYFAGVQAQLHWSNATALLYALLGVAAALVGGWWPARQAERLPPAQTLKGLGMVNRNANRPWLALALLLTSAVLALLPPIMGMPIAAYVAVALLLMGGIALLPWLVQWLLKVVLPLAQRGPLALLSIERAHRMRGLAAISVGGVVASLSLAVALTVMVSSFRTSVNQWLETVVPAPVYVRAAGLPSGDDAAIFSAEQVQAIANLPAVERLQAQRVSSLRLSATQAPVTILARPLGNGAADVARILPLVGEPLTAPSGHIPVYISEAIESLYNVHPGDVWPALAEALPGHHANSPVATHFFVAGVWRDYVRQFGAIAMQTSDYARVTGDTRASDLAIWPKHGADFLRLRASIEGLMQNSSAQAAAGALDFTTSEAIRARSLAIFDRTFAITYWLQMVAIGIGLFGVAASFSAQVLARRKEFGLLAHLGLTRAQILAVVAYEGAAWTAIGAVAGTLLGIAISAVLIYVVNPQSFHWTMDLQLPWSRLLLLAVSLIVCGTLTAWIAARAAASRSAVLAVKEDW